MSKAEDEIVAWKIEWKVPMQGGVVNLPQEFREVADAANRFGLQGLELVDVEVGIDLEAARRGALDPGVCVALRFRPRDVMEDPNEQRRSPKNNG